MTEDPNNILKQAWLRAMQHPGLIPKACQGAASPFASSTYHHTMVTGPLLLEQGFLKGMNSLLRGACLRAALPHQ